MKKYLSLGLFMAIVFLSNAQTKQVRVEGNFPKWTNGDQVVLLRVVDNALKQDTTKVVKGKFSFKLELDQPSRLSVYSVAAVSGKIKDNNSFYIDQGTVKLTGKDSLKNAVIKGSKITVEAQELDKQVAPFQHKLVNLRQHAQELLKDESKKAELEQLNVDYKLLIDSLRETKVSFIKTHPQSFLSLITLNEFLGGAIDYNFAQPLLSGLSADLQKSSLGKDAQRKITIAKATNIGEVLPDFTSKDTLGSELSLTEVVKKGKVTLVDFWASWCVPCRKENPNIVKAYKEFHHKGFNILSVSLDRSAGAWKQAIVNDEMTWYHVSSLNYWDEPVAKLYGITGVPDSFLLDGQGKVIARGLRAEALYAKLQEILD
ncbi:TlpA disulfide reductase family protein [Sphingobacterium sp. MYb382]|uniref:TlpA disulfide reductase family protein n=1 Tax=Sphingobacterium sp. MYb382 TaxID=2745278 RepID=UPI0030A3F5A1